MEALTKMVKFSQKDFYSVIHQAQWWYFKLCANNVLLFFLPPSFFLFMYCKWGSLFQGCKQTLEKYKVSWASSPLYSGVDNCSELRNCLKNLIMQIHQASLKIFWNYAILAVQLKKKKIPSSLSACGLSYLQKIHFSREHNGKGSSHKPKSKLQIWTAGCLQRYNPVTIDILSSNLTLHSCLFPLSQADLTCQLIHNVSLLRCHVMLLSMWKYIICPSLL